MNHKRKDNERNISFKFTDGKWAWVCGFAQKQKN